MFLAILESQKRVEATVTEQVAKVLELENEGKELKSQVYVLQNTVNRSEQDKRKCSVRISGIHFTEEEKTTVDPKFLAKKVYDKLLFPLLTYAKAKNLVDKVPKVDNVIESCYRLRANEALTGTAAPPPIILKFCSEQLKLGVLKVKRLSMPAPPQEEKDAEERNFLNQSKIPSLEISILHWGPISRIYNSERNYNHIH